jgi:succinate-acetate transporter protein
MQLNNNENPENDPTTFGQLVPLLLISLTVFTFLQIVSGMHASRLLMTALGTLVTPN